jgi:hypothetical protein
MPQIKQHDAIARFDLAQEAHDLSRYFKETFAGGFDRERRAGDDFDTRRMDGGQFGRCVGQCLFLAQLLFSICFWALETASTNRCQTCPA